MVWWVAIPETSTSSNQVLDHPIRLKLYLYVRDQPDAVGIRETQRALGITSPSTVNWHLDKLVEARYLIKNHDNRYQLNGNHQPRDTFEVTVKFTARLIRNTMVTPLTFILVFIIAMIILTAFIWLGLRDPYFIGLQGVFSLLVSLVIILYIQWKVRQQLQELKTS